MNERDKEFVDTVANIIPGVYSIVYESGKTGVEFTDEALEAFADLIRADEREACAKVCEDYTGQDYDTVSDLLAEAIRARRNNV